MKKASVVISLIFCFLFVMPVVAYGENNNIIVGVPAEEDLGEYKDRIYNEYCCEMEEKDENYQPSESDIEYDKAVRVYWDMPALEKDELTRDDMEEFARLSYYIYCVPFHYNNSNAELLITRGGEILKENRYNIDLPENSNKFYMNYEKPWHIGNVSYDFYCNDYVKVINNLLDDYNIKNSTVYYLNSINALHRSVLVIFNENSDNAQFIVIDEIVNHNKIVPNTEFGKRPYTYSELKEIKSTDSFEFNEGYAGYSPDSDTNLQYALIAGGVVLAVSAMAIIINFAMKKRAKPQSAE